ncbi:transposase family protein [Nonomuraea sp. NPDC005650]|uniref:transposase family protein n=1 Tax=Nonomuraea sp. NPDC005650 TaxID=3157045 RepID=UPI0033A825AD
MLHNQEVLHQKYCSRREVLASTRRSSRPDGNQILSPDNRTYNRRLRYLRCLGERGFALLKGRWRILQHITASPSAIGDIVRAALVLTHFEHNYLPEIR